MSTADKPGKRPDLHDSSQGAVAGSSWLKQQIGKVVDEMVTKAPARSEVSGTGALLALRAQRLMDSGVATVLRPDVVTAVRVDRLDKTHALRSVQRWHRIRASGTPMAFLALMGATGRGKTVAGAWLLAELGGVYVTAETARRAYSGGWTERQRFDRIMTTRVVVLDDVGTEGEERRDAAMFELINGRSRGWTLLTSNLTAEEFRERYGERTHSRIADNGAFVKVQGENLRKGKV